MPRDPSAPLLGSQFVFDRLPWLMPPDEADVQAFMRREGELKVFDAHTNYPFAYEDNVWLIETGMVAAYVGGYGRFQNVAALWPPNSVLGGNRALMHGPGRLNISARMLDMVTAYEVEGDAFRAFVEESDERHIRVLQNYLHKHTALLEGTLINDLMTVRERLALMICVLARVSGLNPAQGSVTLRYPVSVQEFAGLVHSERTVVGRILKKWDEDGVIRKFGRYLTVTSAILEEIPERDQAGDRTD